MNTKNSACLLVLLVSIISVTCKADTSREESLKMYIMQSFNGMEPNPTRCTSGPPDVNKAYKEYCNITYRNIDYEKETVASIGVSIMKFSDNKYIKGEIIMPRVLAGKGEINNELKNSIGQDKFILYNKDNTINRIYWVSGNNMLLILAYGNEIPKELLDGYMAKYPPTETFTAEDFDAQKILKKKIDYKLDQIEEGESKRSWWNSKFDKGDYYVGMVKQCRAEMDIRCQLGLTDSAANENSGPEELCPGTFNFNGEEREKEWKYLKNSAKEKPVLIERVNWTNPEHGNCGGSMNDIMFKAMEILEMTPGEGYDIPVDYLPHPVP